MPTMPLLSVPSDEDENSMTEDHARLTTILDIPGNSPSIQHHTIPLTKSHCKKAANDEDDYGGCQFPRPNKKFFMKTFIFISLLNFLVFMYLQPILLQVHFTIPLTRNINIIMNRVVNRVEHSIPVVYTESDVWTASFLGRRKPNIPHILHQTWRDQRIPLKFVPFLLSWAETHPHWEYWMWSDKDNDNFVKKCYPDLLKQYLDYGQKIHRVDVARYLLLHQFGGVYADIDTKSLRNMDNLTHIHNFILPKEPPEHAVLLWEKPSLAGNAVLASRPRHPFLDLILAKLSENAKLGTDYEVSAKTGSDMLDRMIRLYSKQNFTSIDYWNATVYYADSKFFLPTFADYSEPIIREVCNQRVTLKEIRHYRVCQHLKKTHFQNRVPPEAYTNHRWLRHYSLIKQSDDYLTNYSDLKERVAMSKNVSKIIDELTFDEKTRRCLRKGL